MNGPPIGFQATGLIVPHGFRLPRRVAAYASAPLTSPQWNEIRVGVKELTQDLSFKKGARLFEHILVFLLLQTPSVVEPVVRLIFVALAFFFLHAYAEQALKDLRQGDVASLSPLPALPAPSDSKPPVLISMVQDLLTQLPQASPLSPESATQQQVKPLAEEAASVSVRVPTRRTELQPASRAAQVAGRPQGRDPTASSQPKAAIAAQEITGPLSAPTVERVAAIAPEVTSASVLVRPVTPTTSGFERRVDGALIGSQTPGPVPGSVGDGLLVGRGPGGGARAEVSTLSSLRGCVGLGTKRRALADALSSRQAGQNEIACEADGRRYRVFNATDRNGFAVSVAAPPSLVLGDQCQESDRLLNCLLR
jgi:hypothetical protein